MFMNGVSSRRWPGRSAADRHAACRVHLHSPAPAGSTVTISTMLRTVAPTTADGRQPRPALVLEVRLDGHRERQHAGADEVDQRAAIPASAYSAGSGAASGT